MSFNIDDLDKLLPMDLAGNRGVKIKDGLKQFLGENLNKTKFYTDFYSTSSYKYFLQGDLIKEIRFPEFNIETHQYEKKYFDALILSNTCDIDEKNKRNIQKNAILAKVISLELFIESLNELNIDNATEILTQIKNQQYTNVIYFPPDFENKEYIAYLDYICYISNDELNNLKSDIKENRIAVLDYFGYYLFIFKLSYHLCRIPETAYR